MLAIYFLSNCRVLEVLPVIVVAVDGGVVDVVVVDEPDEELGADDGQHDGDDEQGF